MLVASLDLSRIQLLMALKTVVELHTDPGVLADHQLAQDRVIERLRANARAHHTRQG